MLHHQLLWKLTTLGKFGTGNLTKYWKKQPMWPIKPVELRHWLAITGQIRDAGSKFKWGVSTEQQKVWERNGWDLLRVENIPRPTTWDGAKISVNNGIRISSIKRITCILLWQTTQNSRWIWQVQVRVGWKIIGISNWKIQKWLHMFISNRSKYFYVHKFDSCLLHV